MQKYIRAFQSGLNGLFRELILGVAAHELGMQHIASDSSMSVSILLAGGAVSEPIYASELIAKKDAVRRGVSELFQSKAIALWGDLLCDLYGDLVREHLQGGQKCDFLSSKKVNFDFKSSDSMTEQLLLSLVRDFSFQDYKSKYKEIKNFFHLDNLHRQAAVIAKHVELRNAFQHHGGVMHAGGMKNLGLGEILLKNDYGEDFSIVVGQNVHLSSVEVDILKSNLFQIASCMEVFLEKN